MSVNCIILGAAHWDRIGYGASDARGTSAPGRVEVRCGGVARNVACGLQTLGARPLLVSAVADDADGAALKADLAGRGLDVAGIFTGQGLATATYLAVIGPDGSLLGGVADMGVYAALTPALLAPLRRRIEQADLVFADANLPAETLVWLGGLDRNGLLAADCVSKVKALRLAPILGHLDVLFANCDEAAVLLGRAPEETDGRAETAARQLCEAGAGAALISDGRRGAALCRKGQAGMTLPAVPAIPLDETGAGDALVAGTLFGLLKGLALERAIRAGLVAAGICVATRGADLPQSVRGAVETALKGSLCQ